MGKNTKRLAKSMGLIPPDEIYAEDKDGGVDVDLTNALREDYANYIRYAERTCRGCNKTFLPKVPNQWYCSKECRDKCRKEYTPKDDMNVGKVKSWTEKAAEINRLAREKGMSYGMYVATEGAGRLATKVSFPSWVKQYRKGKDGKSVKA